MAATRGKILCSFIDAYFFHLVDIRTYMMERGVWTVKAGVLASEIREKSVELAKLIGLD